LLPDLRRNLRASAFPLFPSYSAAERLADRIVHLCGFTGATVAIAWLWGRIGPEATSKQIGAVSVYSFGLVGMISASGLYNFARPGSLKAVLRCLDHAMIFVMIAGSYTPFALNALSPEIGFPLCAVVWGLAGIGIALKLVCPNGNRMGWLVLGVLP
jgi:hemolysin III